MRRALATTAAAAGVCGLLALVQLVGAVHAEGTVLPCTALHPDCVALQWLYGWGAERLLSGDVSVGAHTLANYWPVGDRPLLGGGGLVYWLLAPWQWLLGWPEALLPFAATVLWCNGMAGYALARGFGVQPAPALLGAVVLGLSPFAAEELSAGRLGEGSLAPLALFLAAWNQALTRGGAGRMVLAAGLLAVTAAVYWYAGWFAVLAGLGLWLVRLGSGQLQARVSQHALFCVVALALLAGLGRPFVEHWGAVPGVAALSFPPPSAATDRLQLALWAPPGAPPSLVSSVLPLPLLILAAVRPAVGTGRRAALGLAGIAVCFIALGMGDLGPWSPYRLLYGLAPPLQRFWWPVRHAMVVQCLLAVLAAQALGALDLRGLRRLLVPAAIALTAVCWRLQGAPLAVSHTPVRLDDAGWSSLVDAPEGAVLSLPLSPAASASNVPMLWQLRHGHPMLTGHSPWVARARPSEWDRFIAENTFLVAIQELEQGTQHGDRFTFTGDDLEALRAEGLRWIVLDRALWAGALTPQRTALDGALDELFGRPHARSASVVVWDLNAWTGRTAVQAANTPWPPGLEPAGPERPLQARRPASSTLGSPAGPRAPQPAAAP
jgi:hypothetical protein